jgi:peptidoglycan hydrolase CwlO-like protein
MPTNKTNFFEIKNMLIILLGIIVVGMFLFGKNVINKHATEIKALQTENTTLLNKNESLKKDNDKLDIILGQIDLKLSQNNKDTDAVLSELDKLNGKKNEIPNYVNSLSANGTADALAKYLENRTKGDGSKH